MVDRDRLAQELTNRSPLSLAQLEAVIGPVTQDNKRLAWDFMQLPKPEQYRLHLLIARWQTAFPEAKLTGYRKLK